MNPVILVLLVHTYTFLLIVCQRLTGQHRRRNAHWYDRFSSVVYYSVSVRSAAVAGNVFASPNASQVARAIELVDGNEGYGMSFIVIRST